MDVGGGVSEDDVAEGEPEAAMGEVAGVRVLGSHAQADREAALVAA